MEAQLQKSFNQLLHQPCKFNQISKEVIIQLAKIHNTHNRLIPADLVADLIQELYSINPFQNSKSSLKFAFSYNIVRHIVTANFHDLKDNKIFSVIAMIYAEKLSQFYHQIQNQQKSRALIRGISQITIINEITLKYSEKIQIFFPQYIRVLKVCIKKFQHFILRNIQQGVKDEVNQNKFNNIEALLKLAFSKETDKEQLIFIVVGLLSFVLNQANKIFDCSSKKKEILKLYDIQEIITILQQLKDKIPQLIKQQLSIPAYLQKYKVVEGQQKQQQEDQIYLDEPIQIRQLTPRFYNEQQSTQIKFLRKKKNKLQKKMQLQLRQSISKKLQQKRVAEDVRRNRVQRQVKKQVFMLQKQTQETKKAFKQMKKVKNIKKQSKLGRKGKK